MNNIEFASKCIPKAFLQEEKDISAESQIGSLHNEIKLLRKLTHPSIIQIHEIYEGQSTFYIIFELLKGPTLSKLIRSNAQPFDVEEIRTIIRVLIKI